MSRRDIATSRSGDVVVVTGGASGIGRAVALEAAKRGASVAVVDNDLGGAEHTVAEIHAAGGVAMPFECDVSDEASVESTFAKLAVGLDNPTCLVTAAGIDRSFAAHEISLATWRAVLDTNLTGTFLCCRAMIRTLIQHDAAGAIVCCSSPAASVAYPAGRAVAYSASKAGVSALVRCLAIEYASYGIRVNAVVPGATETPLMWANTATDDIAQMRSVINSEVPLGRLAQPVEPAGAILWLLSGEAAYVTGSHLVCDGGILAQASISF